MSRLASFPKALLHEVLKRGPGALEFQPPPPGRPLDPSCGRWKLKWELGSWEAGPSSGYIRYVPTGLLANLVIRVFRCTMRYRLCKR